MTNMTALALGEALLAATFETTIAKTKTFQLSLADFPIEAALAFMQYGIGRKFNDAVGGADKDAATKVELAEGMIADWKAGKIGRQARESVTDEVKVRRAVLADLLKGTPAWDKLKGLEAAARAEKLDTIFEKQGADAQAAILASVAERIEAAEAKKKQARDLAALLDL